MYYCHARWIIHSFNLTVRKDTSNRNHSHLEDGPFQMKGLKFYIGSLDMPVAEKEKKYLQLVAEEFVHLGHFSGHTEVDRLITNLNDETAADIGIDLGHNLQFLALTNVFRLGNGGLQLLDDFVVKWRGACHNQLDLSSVSAHKFAEVLAHRLQHAQPIVLSERLEEVFDDVGFVRPAGVLLELGNDLLLVVGLEGGGEEDLLELWVPLEDGEEAVHGFCYRLESGCLFGGRIQSTRIGSIDAEEGEWRLAGNLGRLGGRGSCVASEGRPRGN